MSAARHHIGDDLLVSYAAGALAEGWSLAVATHLALCPDCRSKLRLAEEVGGRMLESLTGPPAADDAFDKLMSRVRGETIGDTPRVSVQQGATPEPLRSYIGGDLASVPWKRLGIGAHHFPISTGDGVTSVRLIKISAGVSVPEHGHGGMELTVVLAGQLHDGDLIFRRGDIEETSADVEHQPVAGPGEPCICLAVTDAPLKFKGWFVRFMQPLLGI